MVNEAIHHSGTHLSSENTMSAICRNKTSNSEETKQQVGFSNTVLYCKKKKTSQWRFIQTYIIISYQENRDTEDSMPVLYGVY